MPVLPSEMPILPSESTIGFAIEFDTTDTRAGFDVEEISEESPFRGCQVPVIVVLTAPLKTGYRRKSLWNKPLLNGPFFLSTANINSSP